ncbi:hypothetical protein Tco_1439551, partial [Tanacetum coccineum]
MSSPNHPTSDIEDAFSSNFPDYILASPDYVPASPGNTFSSSFNNSFGLVPIASPTLSLFPMKVMHAYYAKESPIRPPTIVPPSSMLSPMFNPQEFFLPEELLPLKKRGRNDLLLYFTDTTSAFEIGEIAVAAIKKVVADSVSVALEAQAANMATIDNTTRPREAPVARYNYTEDCNVKFATGTLTEEALSWWNYFAQPIGIEEAYTITWVEFKKLLIKK